MDRIGYKQKF